MNKNLFGKLKTNKMCIGQEKMFIQNNTQTVLKV